MSFESVLRKDILRPELLKKPKSVKVVAEQHFNFIKSKAQNKEPTKTPEPAKNIIEAMELIKTAFEDYEKRLHITKDAKINIVYENPDTDAELEAISICLERREPGMYSQGSPFEGKTKQLRPILREVTEDPENPGYQRMVLGQYYDNILRLTAWARTNKAANERALWIETVIEEYTWFFIYSGINRFLYQGRAPEQVKDINGNKIYGRSIDYFVRTEKLRSVSEKVLEELHIRLGTSETG